MSSKNKTRNEKDLGVLSRHVKIGDLPSHTKLKYRETGQNTVEDLKRKNYRRELEEKERIAYEERNEKNRSNYHRHNSSSSNSSTHAITSNEERLALPSTSSSSTSNKKNKTDHHKQQIEIPLNIDADDPVYLSDDDEEKEDDKLKNNDTNSENDDSDAYSEDEDDAADLLAELNKIKKERAQEEAKKEAELKAKEERIRIENIIHGNPLNNRSEFKVKRRWDDDVVFKNCSRGDVDDKEKPFINDTLRSEFHKKFMEKYIK